MPRQSTRRSHSEREVVDLSSYDVCVELDVVKCAFLTPTSMLLSLRTGEVYALRLHLPATGGRSGGARAGGGAPNRVVGQSMRPVGRASPCSVLAVSAGGERDGGSDRGRGGGDSTGLVFMGSRVGDSLLVKYAVVSAGTRPGKRGKGGVGASGPKRELKEEVDKEVEKEELLDGGQARGAAANGAVGSELAAAGAVATAAGEGGKAVGDPAARVGVGRVDSPAVKEEPKEAAASFPVGNGGIGHPDGVAPGPTEAPVDASAGGAAATAAAAATGADGSITGGQGMQPATGEAPPSETDAPADAPSSTAKAGETEAPTAPPSDGGGGGKGHSAAEPTPTSVDRSESSARGEDDRDPRDGGDPGSRGSSSSMKRGRAERSPSPDSGGDGDRAGVIVEHDEQPDQKRSRVSTAAAGGNDPAESPVEAASPAPAQAAAAEGGEQGSEAIDTRAADPATSPKKRGGFESVDAMDTTSPPPAAGAAPAPALSDDIESDGVEHNAEELVAGAATLRAAADDDDAEKYYGEDAETTRLIVEELEMIHEEEELYGARLGSSRPVGDRGSHGAPLANLGSKDGERVIEAVGFRLKVRRRRGD